MAARFLEDRPALSEDPLPGQDPRGPSGRRGGLRRRAARARRGRRPHPGAHPGARARARRTCPARGRRPAGRRGVPARIPAEHARGHHADVPRRGVAPHSRRRHRRPADPRQAERRRMVAPSRPQRLAPGQRLDLGVDADRAGGAREPRAGRRSRGMADAAAATPGRAGPASGAAPVDARARPAFRARPDHRAGDQAGQRGRTQGLPLLVRHAGRGRAHRRRRRGVPPRLSRRDRCDRHGRAGRRPDDAAGHFDQALGAASALRAGAAPAPARRTLSTRAGSSSKARARATSRSPSTPRRPIAWSRRSTCSSGSPPRRSWPAGTASASRSRPIRSGRSM